MIARPDDGRPRVLIAYHHYAWEGEDIGQAELERQARLRAAGFDVAGFCLTLRPPGPRLSFAELDARWRRGDRELLAMYDRLVRALDGRDVLINEQGANLHPEFVEQLPVFTVFQCFDDPESSHDLSRPAAAAYDLSLVGNVAEVESYRGWGVRHAEWIPLGFPPGRVPPLTYEQVLTQDRDVDLFMMLDRFSPPRRSRVEALAEAFPDAHFYGRGWPRGWLSTDGERDLLRRARVGPNIHNSTGPINARLYYLPASGVMQVCDNKAHLGRVFELGEEVVGFETIDEGIELCRYYLAHEEERRRIAAAGWLRATRDYNEVAVYRRKVDLIARLLRATAPRTPEIDIVDRQRRATRLRRLAHTVKKVVKVPLRGLRGRVRDWLGATRRHQA